MLNTSSSKVRKESLKESSLESKVSSRQSIEEMGSEDSDRCELNSTEGKHWYELLKEKIGFDVNAKKWMAEHPELAYENKSELLIRLACEVCLAKNTEYDPKNENEEQNNKYIRFDTQRIFALFEVANELIGLSDRKNFIEFVCQKGNVQLLEMICKKESSKGFNQIDRQYTWQGTFAGYSKLIDLLQYVVDKRCSQEIVLCIAKKVYGYSHILYNGEQYLNRTQVPNIKKSFNYQDSVVKDLLKQAVKLSYKDAVPVMLSGDIYHSIRLMKWKVFKGKPEFIAAYNMIKEAVADVISSGLENGESCKDSVQNLLDQGIEIDLNKMSKEDLMYQLEYLEKKVISENALAKKELVQELKKLGKEKGEVRLRLTVVGAFISTLFFNYQDKVMKGEPFTLKVTPVDKTKKGKILDKLKKKISKEESIDSIMLELIKLLNSGNHIKSNWFFREVLAKVVNENLDKLKAVCAAICKEPMEELLRGEEVHENVIDVLQFFGVEVLTNKITTSEIPSSCASIADQFMKDINVYSEKEAKEDCSSDELTFSGLTRKIIRELEEKQDLTDKEKKDLVSKAFSKIKEGINILADKTAVKIDIKDIFLSFELINSKIEKEQKREVIELVCQKGNVQLLEMICKKGSEDLKSPNHVEEQYKWQGTFTGYSKLIDLLQYVIDNQCSQEIVLCIAKKIYGYIHIVCNGGQYLEPQSVTIMNGKLNYQNAIVKELLKQVITLDYGDTVSVMLSGDIYHSIRLIKSQRFQEKPEFLAAYNMIKETVADVISSWVEDKQSCKDFMLNLLDQGIEIDLHKMDKEDLMYQLEYLEKKVISKNVITKKELIKKLEEIGKEKGEVRLKSTIVGRLISTLFFNFQDKMMKGELFILKINQWDNNEKGKILDELKISNGKSIEDIVLELVKLLNSGNHIKSNWFFREVLAKVVNENLDKLKAVCAAICKEPMEELLRGEEVHENVIDVLQFFGVEVLTNKITTSEIPSSCAGIADHFVEDVEVYCEKEAKEDCSSDELAFSGLTRKIIRDLEEKKDLTGKEKKDLISKALSEIKEGIDILADGTGTNVDVKDIFLSFKLINSKIEKEQKREIAELVCQKDNVQLLEMICKQESSKDFSKVEAQYKWQGIFTGYSKLIDLLQYVIDNRCSQEIVLYIVKKVYGHAHIFYNGEQCFSKREALERKKQFSYQDSDIKDLLKQAIKLGYKDAVSVMLSGDIYHCIRLIKSQRFQEKPEFLAAYNMIKETVADVISSWVEGCKDDIRRLLDQGIEIDLHKMSRVDLIYQLECLGKELTYRNDASKKELVQEIKKLGKEKGEIKLRLIIVGALISTSSFNYQDKVMKDELFILKISASDGNKKRKVLDELNQKISNGKSIEDIVLKLIQSLNSASHLSNNWFFREVLVKVVNENLDKLKAVCAAICKKPMEELLKGKEVHEDVIDVLQFFGVEKDFLLLKTNVVASVSGVSVRNSQSIDESLSDRSEESISSSSRQSFADARLIRDEYSLTLPDPQKISTAVSINQERQSLPNISSESKKTQQQLLARKSMPFAKLKESSTIPASEVAQRNNEGLIQNYYGQGGKADYSIKQVSSSSYLLSGKYSYVGGRMEEDGMLSKIRFKQRSSLRKNSSGNRLPRVSSLDEAHCERYRKLFLNKIFSYNRFVDLSALLSEDQNLGLNISSSTSSGSSPLTSPSSANDSRDRLYDCDPYLDAVQEYVDGVQLLKGGDEDQGKNKIRSAASKKLEAAMYAYAIINFKEAIAGNITKNISGVECNPQEAVKEAVQCIVDSGKSFFPLNSFILGIMDLYNVGNYSDIVRNISQKSWKAHFADVLRSTKDIPSNETIVKHNLLSVIGSTNLDFIKPSHWLEIVGENEGMKELKLIVDHVSYELAKDLVSNKKHPIAAKYLFEQLSSEYSTDGKSLYPDAQYSYAMALFRGELTEEEKERKIYNLLSQADGCEHQEARLFLGLLLFTKGYEFCRSSNYWNYLESYINVTLDDKDVKQKYFKEKVSVFIAHEYINRSNPYIQYNEEKAKNILKSNSNKNELSRLEKAIEKLQQGSGNLLKNVIKVLKKVQPKLLEKFYSECSDVNLGLARLEELPEKLGASRIIIKEQENNALLSILQELNNIPSIDIHNILQLQRLCFALKREVTKELEPSNLREEILKMLKDLQAVSVRVQLQYFGDSSILGANEKMDARRPSNFETSHMKRSVTSSIVRSSSASSGVFAAPSTPSPTRLKRVRIRSNSSPEITLPQANSTAFDDDVFSNTCLSIDNASAIVDDITPKFHYVDLFIHVNPKDGKHLGVTFNEAADLCEEGHYDKALEIYEEILQERKNTLSYKNFSTVMVAHNVAVLSYALGKSDRSLEVFNGMLKELGSNSPHAEVVKSNIKIVENGLRRVSFTKPSQGLEQGRSGSSGSNSQSMLAIDKDKGGYCTGSSTSGFGSTIGTFSDRQSTNEESGAASLDSKSSKVSSGIKLKQSLSSLQRNVSKTSVSSKSVGRSSQLKSISQSSSRASSATSSSSTTSMPKRTSTEKEKVDDSRSSSLPSSSLRNSKTEEHKSSRGRGNRK